MQNQAILCKRKKLFGHRDWEPTEADLLSELSGPKSFQDLLTLSGPTLRGKCLGTTGGQFLLPASLQGIDHLWKISAFLRKVCRMCWSVNRKAEFVSPSGGMSRIFSTFCSVPCSRCAVPHPPLSWSPLSQMGEGFQKIQLNSLFSLLGAGGR